MTKPIPNDVSMPIIFAALCAAILAVGAATEFTLRRDPPELPDVLRTPESTRPIARAGEWITNPDGSRVCRLRVSIVRGMTFTRDLCEDWQGVLPQLAQTVPWLRWDPPRGGRIMIEGEWRP